MKDCGCKKEDASGNWMGDEEVGDEFLFEEGTNMIKSIERNLKSSQVNKKAIFNMKLDEDQLSMLVLDDTVIDYSYIDEDDDTMINYEVQQSGEGGEESDEADTETENETVEESSSEEESDEGDTETENETVEESDEGDTETEEEEYGEEEESREEEEYIVEETEEPVEDDTEYQEEEKYSSKDEAVKYLKDLL